MARVNNESINAAKQFYSELFKKGTLVWSRDKVRCHTCNRVLKFITYQNRW